MAVELVMPRLSESMEQGTIVSWLVADGSPVASGQEIAEIETDKATLPYEAPEGGVLRILVPEGTTLPLGSPIGLIDDFAGVPAPVAAPAGAAPGEVDLDPPTESFEVHPDLVAPQAATAAGSPHTGSAAGQPPVASAGGGEWSPAWGPQTPAAPAPAQPAATPQPHVAPQPPVGAPPQRPVPPPPLQPAEPHHADEGETTEFEAIDPSVFAETAPATPDQPASPVQPEPPASPAQPAAPQAPAAADPAQPSLADAAGNPWVASPGAPIAGVPVSAPPAAPEAGEAPLPVADGPVPPEPVIPPAAEGTPGPADAAAEPAQEGRFAAEDLIAPPTLAPRPPEQQPAPAAGAPRVLASPVARRLANELGIDLSTLTGSGPEGRIVRADIEAAQAEGAARPPRPTGATPAAASEFTPPVDEARAAAPIPEPEPAPEVVAAEPAPVAAEPAPVAAEPELEAVAPEPEVVAAEPEPEAVAPEPEAIASEPEVVAPEPEHDASDVAEAEAEAQAEADAAQVVAIAGETAHSIDADDEADVTAPDAEAEPEPATDPQPEAEARILPAAQPGGGKGEPEIVELTRQQATVARRMAESKATIPDFHTTVELDAGPLLTLRADLLATRPDLAAPSVNDLLVKAVAIALRAFPRLNGAYKDGRIEQYPRINVGIATESAGALVVPVIHDADALSVSQIAARTDEILAKAADGGLRPPDIASATFTVSNLGMHGIDEFTAVITPGQAAILTAGVITERPVVRNGNVVAGQTLRLTLTTDHRAVYGLQAAEFLGRVRQLVEHPSSLLA